MKLFIAALLLGSLALAPVSFAAQVEDGDAELQEFSTEGRDSGGAGRRSEPQPTRPGTRDCPRQQSICERGCERDYGGQDNSREYISCIVRCEALCRE